VRSPDPSYAPENGWAIRRLAPHCSKIELKDLPSHAAMQLLIAMGKETANVHVGSSGKIAEIVRDLKRRPASWLEEAAKLLADFVEADWKAYQRSAE